MRMNMSEEKLEGFSSSKSENFEDENGVSDSVSDPDLVEASDSESEIADAEKRRNLRRKLNSRRQNIEDLAEAFDMNDDEKKRMLELVADLMPDTSRMSRADDNGSSTTSARIDFNLPGFCCCSRICKATSACR